jgi:DNA-binding response OmpR family regulator
MKVLIIEDERETALTLKSLLEAYYMVEIAYTGEEGEYQALVNKFDIMLVDYTLPDITGLEVCTRIRHAGVKTPILMLTGQSEIRKKVAAFDSGVDDYLTKPFAIEELLARMRALLRRRDSLNSNLLVVEDLCIDLIKKIVIRENTPINLRRKEFYLLEYLMRNVGQVLTREMILDHVWESNNEAITNVVDVHIKYLRDKIDKPYGKKLIKTIHGVGYKIQSESHH